MTLKMAQYKLSGHESFHCRQFWLKKGHDFLEQGNKFTADEAVLLLGVGKNMVASIRFWLQAFGVSNQDEPTEFGRKIFSDNGLDPYLEDLATIWLLHYYLVKSEYASLYHVMFNQFRKQRTRFERKHVEAFLQANSENAINENTLKRDLGVLLKNYLKPAKKTNQIEEDFSVLFHDLNLISRVDSSKEKNYQIESRERNEIPTEIILFAILDNPSYTDTITFYDLLNGTNSVGNVFALSGDGLFKHIQKITDNYDSIVYKDDAGIRTIQFRERLDKWAILENYYEG
jgi:hypothetical protein